MGIVDGKVAYERIYWDQASLLVQVGLLNPTKLPVVGAEQADKLRHPSLPSNELIHRKILKAFLQQEPIPAIDLAAEKVVGITCTYVAGMPPSLSLLSANQLNSYARAATTRCYRSTHNHEGGGTGLALRFFGLRSFGPTAL